LSPHRVARHRTARPRGRALALAACLLIAPTAASAAPKVVAIGFDGADSRLVEQWMAEGKLPNLSALKDAGSYSSLMPTNPPQTPVSWSAFATGTNPGKAGIFDFLKKDSSRSYVPTLAFVAESKRPFALGERTASVAGLAVFLLGLLATAGLLRLTGLKGRALAAASLALAAAAGAGGYAAASRYLPEEIPQAINNRQGDTFWGILSRKGRKVRVIRVPQTFPAEEVPGGQFLSGLGVPDMRGRVGTPSYYTSEPGFKVNDNEFSVEVIPVPARRGVIESSIYGPFNKPFYEYPIERAASQAEPKDRRRVRDEMRRRLEERGITQRIDIPVTFRVPADGSSATIETSGQTRTLKVGEWSDWFVLDFPVNFVVDHLAALRGIVKFKLLSTAPELRIYMSPVNFHPDCQPVPFSYPLDYASRLVSRLGLFKTIGWAIDTWSLPTGLVDDDFFLEDMNATVDGEEALMKTALSEGNVDLYVQVFEFTDRIGHMFWRYMDPRHPLYAPERAERFQGEMLKAYQRMDAIVGEARRLAGPDALLIVCSDHGFSSWRRGVNYNTWLVKNGFMTIVGDSGQPKSLEDLFETHQLFQNVDWSRTKAYAMGLGGIYINLAGRETQGSVAPGEGYEAVRSEIVSGLEALVDPATGEHPIHKVYRREESYSGFDPVVMPDLRVANNLGYRIGWQTALGEVPRDLFEDDRKAWSGDHCSLDPDLVRGILFMNRKMTAEHPHIMDVFPTVLQVFGETVPQGVDGHPLL
jgi:predicted AlkP superfamily phosphohydrolase/phosphomutase